MQIIPRTFFVSGIVLVIAIGISQRGGAQSAPAAPATSADTDGVIFERQQIMIQLSKDSELLGAIVAGAEPASKLKDATRAIARGAHDSVVAFGTKVPGGRSKPEVWTKNEEFMKQMTAFAQNAEAMAKVGEKGDVGGVTAMMVDAMPCKSCHDAFREPKKS